VSTRHDLPNHGKFYFSVAEFYPKGGGEANFRSSSALIWEAKLSIEGFLPVPSQKGAGLERWPFPIAVRKKLMDFLLHCVPVSSSEPYTVQSGPVFPNFRGGANPGPKQTTPLGEPTKRRFLFHVLYLRGLSFPF